MSKSQKELLEVIHSLHNIIPQFMLSHFKNGRIASGDPTV